MLDIRVLSFVLFHTSLTDQTRNRFSANINIIWQKEIFFVNNDIFSDLKERRLSMRYEYVYYNLICIDRFTKNTICVLPIY